MNPAMVNPFAKGTDRYELWDMLVHRDIEAFMARDWQALKRDFIEEGFFGIDGRMLTSIDSWQLTFPTLEAYGREWRKQAADHTRRVRAGLREALYEATKMGDIEIVGDTALVHRKFNGWLTKGNGQRVNLQWQTLYVCRKREGQWKISSFTGYLPSVSVETQPATRGGQGRRAGRDAWQHVHSLSDLPALKHLLTEIEQFQQSGMTADERGWLNRACELLGAQSPGAVDYTILARKLGVSYEVFRHRFRRLTGLSPRRYRQARLIERASELLRATPRTVAEIALDLGFCDEFHFSRSFKKVMGKSPSEFRRNLITDR